MVGVFLYPFLGGVVVAYSGFLIKVGNYTIPHGIIKAETYNATRNVQDMDSYRDANGVLHRNALAHVPIKVEFETKPLLTESRKNEFMSNIQANYTNSAERRVSATVYVPETGEYVTQDMYLVTPTFTIYAIINGVPKYNSTRIAFVGY